MKDEWEAGREQQAEGTECAKTGGRVVWHVKLVWLECNEHTQKVAKMKKAQTIQGTGLY